MNAVLKKIAAHCEISSFAIRAERPSDVAARETLLDASFGAGRHARTCQRLRDGRKPAEGLALAAVSNGKLIGTVRLWHVSAGSVAALALGPLAVAASHRKLGVGAALMKRALELAQAHDHGAVILLGDGPYYARFGFSTFKARSLLLLGPFERDRLLAVELREAALDGASGLIVPTGARVLKCGTPGKLRGRCRALHERIRTDDARFESGRVQGWRRGRNSTNAALSPRDTMPWSSRSIDFHADRPTLA